MNSLLNLGVLATSAADVLTDVESGMGDATTFAWGIVGLIAIILLVFLVARVLRRGLSQAQ